MIKKFCKKCYGDTFCVEKEPQMNASDIIHFLLASITSNSSSNSLKIFYNLLTPSYRTKLGGFRQFSKYINTQFPNLISSININLLDEFHEIDECTGFFSISYSHNNHNIPIVIHMERAYNYIDNKPLYDPLTKENLYLFWRINKIEKGFVQNGRRTVYSRIY